MGECRSWMGRRRGREGQSQRTKWLLALPLLSSRLGWAILAGGAGICFPNSKNKLYSQMI